MARLTPEECRHSSGALMWTKRWITACLGKFKVFSLSDLDKHSAKTMCLLVPEGQWGLKVKQVILIDILNSRNTFNIIQYHSISFNFAQAYAFWIHFSQQDTKKLCNRCPQLKSGVVEACSMHGAQMGTAWSLCFKAKDLLALIHLNIYMPILSDTIRYNPIPT